MIAHSLHRLQSSIYNTPHLITAEAFEVALSYLDLRNSDAFKLIAGEDIEPRELSSTDSESSLGVLMVDGSLTYKPVVTMCGEFGTSYQGLVASTQAMADAGVKTIVMQVDSGGGTAAHCFETAEDIRAICDDNGIKLIGYAEGLACSAAYALSSVCHELIVNPSATVGSIGCVVALLDTSKAMEQAGLKRIFVTSGANKVPFDAEGKFKDSFLAEIQEDVDRLNTEFAAHVSKYSGLSTEAIKAFEAGVFNAEEAVAKGLADKVMTNKQFAAYVAEQHGATK